MRTVTFEDASHASLLAHLTAERDRCETAVRLTDFNESTDWAGISADRRREATERLPSTKARLAQLEAWTAALEAALPADPGDDAAASDVAEPIEPGEAEAGRARFDAMTNDERVATYKALQKTQLLLGRNAPYGLGTWPVNPDDVLPAGVRIAVIDANAAYIHRHEDHAIGRFTTTEGMTVGTCCAIIEATQALSSIANGMGGGTLLAGRLADEARRLLIRHDVETAMATISPRIGAINPMTLNIDTQGGTDTMLVQLIDE